jgi:hypothetical protein
MHGLCFMRQDEVIVAVIYAWILRLICFRRQGLKAEHRSYVLFSLSDRQVMPDVVSVRTGKHDVVSTIPVFSLRSQEYSHAKFHSFSRDRLRTWRASFLLVYLCHRVGKEIHQIDWIRDESVRNLIVRSKRDRPVETERCLYRTCSNPD